MPYSYLKYKYLSEIRNLPAGLNEQVELVTWVQCCTICVPVPKCLCIVGVHRHLDVCGEAESQLHFAILFCSLAGSS